MQDFASALIGEPRFPATAKPAKPANAAEVAKRKDAKKWADVTIIACSSGEGEKKATTFECSKV